MFDDKKQRQKELEAWNRLTKDEQREVLQAIRDQSKDSDSKLDRIDGKAKDFLAGLRKAADAKTLDALKAAALTGQFEAVPLILLGGFTAKAAIPTLDGLRENLARNARESHDHKLANDLVEQKLKSRTSA